MNENYRGPKCNHQMIAEKSLKNGLKTLNNCEEGILCFWSIPDILIWSLPFLYCHHQMETPTEVLSILNPGWLQIQGVQVGEEFSCPQASFKVQETNAVV